MLKKVLSLVALVSLSMNITACGSDTADLAPLPTETQSTQQVQAQSFLGVYKEVRNASTVAFHEMDTNGDNLVSSSEYGVDTADGQKSFNAIDKNHDGKITPAEMSAGFFGSIGLASRLKKTADGLFKQADLNKDKLLSKEEITSAGLSSAFISYFSKYDTQKKTLLHKDAPGMLSQSEFENLYAFISVNNFRANNPTPAPSVQPSEAPAPADPSAPTDPSTPAANPDDNTDAPSDLPTDI